MTSQFDLQALLSRLPQRRIGRLDVQAVLPRARAVGNLSSYNGFTGKERLRTFEVAKWLQSSGVMTTSGECDICHKPADQLHAENYYDLEGWIDLCRGCHTRLHQRFRFSVSWKAWLDRQQIGDDHWSRFITDTPIDIASLRQDAGEREPTYADFIEAVEKPKWLEKAFIIANFDDVIDRASAGEEIIVVRNGVPRARLVSAQGDQTA